MISTTEDYNKYKVWRDIIQEAKALTAAGYGHIRIVRGISYDLGTVKDTGGSNTDHMDR